MFRSITLFVLLLLLFVHGELGTVLRRGKNKQAFRQKTKKNPTSNPSIAQARRKFPQQKLADDPNQTTRRKDVKQHNSDAVHRRKTNSQAAFFFHLGDRYPVW
jgi:hypothetical protein